MRTSAEIAEKLVQGLSKGLTIQWQMMSGQDDVSESVVMDSVSDNSILNDDGDSSPVETFLVRSEEGYWQLMKPTFREKDYGMMLFDIRGPIGPTESPVTFVAGDSRLFEIGLVKWRFKRE